MEQGTVTTVKYKDGVVYCNVRPVRVGTTYRNVPVLNPHSGFIQVPKQGQKVGMSQLENGPRFIHEVFSKQKHYPDNGTVKEGELIFQLDEDTRLKFEEREDEKYDLNIKTSGDINVQSEKDVTVQAEQDVNVDATEKVNIDGQNVLIDGIDFDQHTHDYTWTDSGGSGTTDPPK